MAVRYLAALALCVMAIPAAALEDQSGLKPVINAGLDAGLDTRGRVLEFNWPALRVGTAEYAEGPTGVTVFHFDRKVYSAIDVRGGGPGTVNSDYMRLGYDMPELDTVVFAGGSWYGLEAVTAVASALKDDGIRDGNAFSLTPNIAMSVGSIIFDFGTRRLNEIYPDKALAQAAFRNARSGRFALGAQGAGRFAVTGGLFGCNAYSGQGGAFRQFGDVKIAAFTIVNALGVVTDRDGKVAACYRGDGMAEDLKASDLAAAYPAIRKLTGAGKAAKDETPSRNTTVSLIVTNLRMEPAELQRLATQVHTSMARGLQPYATIYDGDVLYAVSTAELESADVTPVDLGVMASELMWDAILSSVPAQPQPVAATAGLVLTERDLRGLAGDYRFSPFVSIKVTQKGNRLYAQATGARAAYAIGTEAATELLPVSNREFTVPGRYPLVLRFGPDRALIINPGHWQQIGRRK